MFSQITRQNKITGNYKMKYDKTFYNSLNRSSFTPPSYIFGIVWPILYFSLAIVFFLVKTSPKCVNFCTPLQYFSIQLIFNLLWTTLFFRLQMPRLALLDLALIVGFTLLTMHSLYSNYRNAFYVMLPYTLWIMFAFYLNIYIVVNN